MYKEGITELIEAAKLLRSDKHESLCNQISIAVSNSLSKGGKLLFVGNGGSAAEAQHMAAEYIGTLSSKNYRIGYRAISLSTDTSFLSAWANDFDFASVFSRQVEVLGDPGDILFAYSTSGNSKNVLNAVESAKLRGLCTIAFTGQDGGTLGQIADFIFRAPSDKTARIQELHTFFGHTICALVENQLGDINS